MRPDPFEVKPFPSLKSFKATSGPTERLRVCIATEEIYGPIRNGGIASTYYHLARMLADAGHDVTVLYLKSDKSENGPISQWIEFYEGLGIRFVPLPMVPVTGASFWQQRLYSTYVWLKNQGAPFDIIHASEWRGGAYYALLAKQQGLAFEHTLFLIKASSPHIWNRHYMMEFMHDMGLFSVMYPEQMSIELADMVIGGSAHLLRFMEHVGYQLPEKRTYVQPNVLQFDSTDIVDQRDSVEPGDVLHTKELVFFGRLEARKGLEVFCDALDFLVARGTLPERVVFMGKQAGNLPSHPEKTNKSYIEMRAKRWPFPFQIEPSFHQPEALSFLMEKPRIAVMPSLVENSSMAVYEALMYKIPFIATAVGGTPELVAKPDRKKVLSEANPRDLANALERALEKGALVARCSFDNDQNLAVWQNFHELLSHRKAGGKLDALSAPRAKVTKQTLSLCVYSDGNPDQLSAFLDTAVFAGGEDLLEIIVAAATNAEKLKTVIAESKGKVVLTDAHELSLGEAYNAAAKQAKGDVLLFLRSDIHTPLEGFAGVLRKAFRTSGAVALTSVWRWRENDDGKDEVIMPLGADRAMAIIDKNNLSGRGIAATSDMLRDLGGFNPIFGMGGIEQDLLMRAADKGKVQIVPEPLYTENESRMAVHLNERNAQYMANSALIDAAPYFMKRTFLMLGFLTKSYRDHSGAGLMPELSQLSQVISPTANFVNQSPVPQSGYDKQPVLRLGLDEATGEFEIEPQRKRSVGTLRIELNEVHVADVAVKRQPNGRVSGRWNLHSVREKLGGSAQLRISVDGEPRGPYRLLRLTPLGTERIAIVSKHNYIETVHLAEPGKGNADRPASRDVIALAKQAVAKPLRRLRRKGDKGSNKFGQGNRGVR